ncbi:MAG: enhanced serine sensitivity protein SseB [Firmicutes bacterium]|nr:enhanced serine sensitivity protein SseB [Bacillota bacterium]
MENINNIDDAINNQALLDAINAHKEEQSGNTQAKMAIELVRAKFFTPMEATIAPDENGNYQLNKGEEIKLNVINSADGEKYLLAFTSWEELEKWEKKENQQTLLSRFADYERMLFESGDLECKGFVIDPFGANVVLTRRNMIAVRDVLEEMDYEEEEEQQMPQPVQKPEEKNVVSVKVSELKDCPKELSEAIRKQLESDKGIKKAYLQSIVKGEEPGYLVAVEFEGDKDKILRGVLEVAKHYLPKGYSIDIMPCEDKLKEMLEKVTKPFFER